MKFRTFCEHKGCRKEMEPVLDKETMKVYCTACDRELQNVTIFMRNQMLAYGQVKKNVSKKMAFSVVCSSCGKSGPPVVDENGELVCSFCSAELNLSKPFEMVVRQKMKLQK